MPDVRIRPAETADSAVLARLQRDCWRATYGQLNPAMVDGLDLDLTARAWATDAADPTRRIRLAECDGEPAGYAASGANTAPGAAVNSGELEAVYLLPAAHGLGLGRRLVEDALAGLTRAGYVDCVLWVAVENAHAIGFYHHLGFRPDGARGMWRGLRVARYTIPTAD